MGSCEKGNVPGTGFGQFASNADSNAGLTQLSLRETSSRNGVDYEELFLLRFQQSGERHRKTCFAQFACTTCCYLVSLSLLHMGPEGVRNRKKTPIFFVDAKLLQIARGFQKCKS